MNIVAISGGVCTGKSTLREGLMALEPGLTHTSFAFALKQGVLKSLRNEWEDGMVERMNCACPDHLLLRCARLLGLTPEAALAWPGLDEYTATYRSTWAGVFGIPNSSWVEMTENQNWNGIETAENKHILRAMYQAHGTAMRELHGVDYWVNLAIDKARSSGHNFIVIDDVRFPNEVEGAEALADRFLSVRLLIDPDTQRHRYTELYGAVTDEQWAKTLSHISERALDDFDDFGVIINATVPAKDILTTVLNSMEARKFVLVSRQKEETDEASSSD